MLQELRRHVDDVVALVERLQPAAIDGTTAALLLAEFGRLERRCAAAKVLLLGRVAATGAWQGAGDRTAAQWLARTSGTSVGSAISTVRAAEAVVSQSETAAALQQGLLSEEQVRVVAPAVAADPSAESTLVATAQFKDLRGLREDCERLKAAAEPDRYAAVHRQRSLRTWVHDQEFHLRLNGPVDAGAAILAAIAPHRRAVELEAKRQDRREDGVAHAFDALVRMARGSSDGSGDAPRPPGVATHVLVDYSALARGESAPGETCEIAGLGPIPVPVARALAADSFLSIVLSDGVDVRGVARHGRTVSAHTRTALEARSSTCEIEGCSERERLQIDHVRGYAITRQTTYSDLRRLCRWHHYQKTFLGWVYERTPNGWRLRAPRFGDPPPASRTQNGATGPTTRRRPPPA